MKPICLIPARSGSKGLKDKNMLFLDNKPMIFHTIDCAINSGLFDKKDIYVSTDSTLYKDICETKGITVKLRPDNLASDTSTTYDLNEYFLKDFDDEQVFVLLQVTSPLRSSDDLIEAMKLYSECNADNVVSFTKVEKSPRLFTTLTDDGCIVDNIGIDKGYRRQNEKQLFCPNGAIFISSKKVYLREKSYFTEKTKAYIMSMENSIDVDNKYDFTNVIGQKYFDYENREKNMKKYFEQTYENLVKGINETNLILGDSRMLNFSRDDYYNLSIGGVTLDTLIDNIHKLDDKDIKNAIVSIGVNDITTKYSNSTIKNNFIKLFDFLKSKNSKIYLTTIMYTLFRAETDNDKILEFNKFLLDYAKNNDIKIIKLNELVSKDYKLMYELTSDGLHLNSVGEKKIFDFINEFIDKN